MTEEFDFNRVPGKNPHTVKTKYIKKGNKLSNHLEILWCAMYVSEGWYESYRRFSLYSVEPPLGSDSLGREYGKLALRYKAIGIVEYDRMLNKYDEAMKDGNILKKVFVFGDSDV